MPALPPLAGFGALGPGWGSNWTGLDLRFNALQGSRQGGDLRKPLDSGQFPGALPAARGRDQSVFPGTSSPGQRLSALGLCPGGQFAIPKHPRTAILLQFFKLPDEILLLLLEVYTILENKPTGMK